MLECEDLYEKERPKEYIDVDLLGPIQQSLSQSIQKRKKISVGMNSSLPHLLHYIHQTILCVCLFMCVCFQEHNTEMQTSSNEIYSEKKDFASNDSMDVTNNDDSSLGTVSLCSSLSEEG